MRGFIVYSLCAAGLLGAATDARAQDFNWKAQSGKTLNFLSSNHPWANAVLAKKGEFEALTGVKIQVDTFQEAQMRQRLVTVLQSKSADVDLYMSLKSREGLQFANAGWFADLSALAASKSATGPAFDPGDFSKGLLAGETFKGRLTGVPLNIEGPVIYLRKDVFERCKVALPAALEDLPKTAAALKACDPSLTAFASRGAKGAISYTFSNFLHNLGGDYFDKAGKSAMCAAPNKAALTLYSGLLKDFGPPGVVNVSFLQLRELFGQGKAAMIYESSNEFGPITKFDGRLADTSVRLLPPGAGGSRPTVIGWGLAVSGYSKNTEAAWLFAQWAASKEMQGELALQGIAPPRVSVAASPAYAKYLTEAPVRGEWAKALDEMAKTGTSEVGPPMEQQPEARDVLGEAVQKMILGQQSADEACAEIDAKTNALLEKEKH